MVNVLLTMMAHAHCELKVNDFGCDLVVVSNFLLNLIFPLGTNVYAL